MSNKEDKKYYIRDDKKNTKYSLIPWGVFLICLIAFCVSLSKNLPDDISTLIGAIVFVPFILGLIIPIYLNIKPFLKESSKEEFLNFYQNAETTYVEQLLIKYGFNEKEIAKILKDRPIGELLKSRHKSQSIDNPIYEVESIEEFLDVCNSSEEEKENLKKYYDMFEKLSFSEKIKSCYGKGANTLHSLKMDSFDDHAYFRLLCDSIDNSGDKENLRQLISKEIEREKKQKNYDLDYIEVSCLSSSDKTIDDRNYKMTIKDGYIYLLKWMYIIEDDLKEPFKNTKENYYALYGEDYYSFEKCTKFKIKLSDIIFYTTDGTIENYTITSGGGTSGNIDEIKARIAQRSKGSDSSVLLSGDMAAMYSMLQDIKVDPITTKVVSDDKRMVILKTKNMDLVFSRIATFPARSDDLYMWLVGKLPDKDLERMNVLKDNNKDKSSSSSNLDEIKKLKELLDMNAISKEEFEKKKKELLK